MHTISEQAGFISGGINMILRSTWWERLMSALHWGKYLAWVPQILVAVVTPLVWGYLLLCTPLEHASVSFDSTGMWEILWSMKHKQTRNMPLPGGRLLPFAMVVMETDTKNNLCHWTLEGQFITEPREPGMCLVWPWRPWSFCSCSII